MRKATKELALFALSLMGGFHFGRWMARHRLVVLTYHSVIRDRREANGVRPRNSLYTWEFEQQVEYLVHQYHVISGNEFYAFLTGHGSLPRYSVLITFDDGYENNYTEAFPILQRYGLRAIFFITTGLIGQAGAALWFDRLEALLVAVPSRDMLRWLSCHGGPVEVRHPQQVGQWLKRLPRSSREQIIAGMEHDFGGESSWRCDGHGAKLMTWEQVREMAALGMTIGSHTAGHQILSSASPEELHVELVVSRQEIEYHIGVPCWCFCYPNGEATDFRPSDKAAVQSAGYACAFSQIPGFIVTGLDRYALPRMAVPDSGNIHVFRNRLTGVHSLLQTTKVSVIGVG
jgi:peptidoglycan/xylan/chitin deacetylase (PgdA/CDA1 family)